MPGAADRSQTINADNNNFHNNMTNVDAAEWQQKQKLRYQKPAKEARKCCIL